MLPHDRDPPSMGCGNGVRLGGEESLQCVTTGPNVSGRQDKGCLEWKERS